MFTMFIYVFSNASANQSTGSKYSVEWLEQQLGQGSSGMSSAEFAMTVITLLTSSRSSDDLQTELFDLLGFDRIELITSVLEHRQELIDSHALNKKVMKREIASVAAALQETKNAMAMPGFGCQVIVQSEEEKQLRKQVKKEEKRIQKLMKNVENQDSDEDEFDPKELLVKRQLATAIAKPVIKPKERSPMHVAEKYPYVFDAFAEARQSAAFIQGVKMALPQGFERKDDKRAEEIHIPPTSKVIPGDIGKNLIPISGLDTIGQMAFAGDYFLMIFFKLRLLRLRFLMF